jgi:ribonuclease HI
VIWIVLPDAVWTRNEVFNWPTKAEQGISAKDRFRQKGAVDSATTAVEEVKVAAIRAEQSHKNFRRVDTMAKRQA